MTAIEILLELKRRNIGIKVEGQKLKLSAEKDVITKELLHLIRINKNNIISLLSMSGNPQSNKEIISTEKKEWYSTSSAQKRLYALHLRDPKSTAYNIQKLLYLGKKVDKDEVESIFNQIISRHEILRTGFFIIEYEIVQRVFEKVDFKIKHYQVDYSELDRVVTGLGEPFVFSKPPLLKVSLIDTKLEGHYLLIDIHHIITDATSNSILEKEFKTLFKGNKLMPLRKQYKDFCQWQRSFKYKELLEEQKAYWGNIFGTNPPLLNMYLDYKRPQQRSMEGETASFFLNGDTIRKLKMFAKENGLTLHMVFFGAFALLISKLSNQDDIIIGTPVSGRNHPSIETMVGMMINTLAIRINLNSQLISHDYFKMVKEKLVYAYDNQEYPFENLIDDIGIKYASNRNPLFDVMFNFLDKSDISSRRGIHENTKVSYKKASSSFDLTWTGVIMKGQILFSIEYCTDLFKRSTIERFIKYFKQILRQIPSKMDDKLSSIEILPKEEKRELLFHFNNTDSKTLIDLPVHKIFEKQVIKTPDNIALVMGDEQISYRALDDRANKLAKVLTLKGGKKGDKILLFFNSSIDMVVSIIAVFKIGGIYIPVAPDTPLGMFKHIISDSGSSTLLCPTPGFVSSFYDLEHLKKVKIISMSSVDEVIENKFVAKDDITSEDSLYIIYTSGSTGVPKGVEIRNKGVVNYSLCRISKYNFTPNDITLQLLSYHFDGFGSNFYSSLLSGGKLVLVEEEARLVPELIVSTIEKECITNSSMVPSFLHIFKGEKIMRRCAEFIRLIVLAGEKTLPELLRTSRKLLPNTLFVNEYGPTETSVGATCHIGLDETNTAIIGKPNFNTKIYILGKDNELLPIGVAGELCISGAGLAKGYLNNKSLTDKKFISNPFDSGETLYRTGDLAKWHSNGDIEFLGRLDNQVKIRGFRVELEEIESVLRRFRGVKDSVVIVKERGGEMYLVAYYVSEKEIPKEELYTHVSPMLPGYKIPSYFVYLDKIPLNSSGKLDKKALPEPEFGAGNSYTTPETKIEKQLVDIWSEVLKIDKSLIGITNSFFELGGNSLIAISIINQIHKILNVELSVNEFFNFQNIEKISNYISSLTESKHISIKRAEEKEYYVLSSAQERSFFLHEFDNLSLADNMLEVIRLQGNLEIDKLRKAFDLLIERHEILRTSIVTINGKQVQLISNNLSFEIEYFGADRIPASELIKEFVRPFDLSIPRLLRVGLIKVGADSHLLLLDMHHIIADGVSQGIMINDFMKFYKNEKLKPLKLQYKDYSEWQRSDYWRHSIAQQKEFWLSEFKIASPLLELPTDFTRPNVKKHEGSNINFYLTPEDSRLIISNADSLGITVYMLLLSVFNILLARLTTQDDIVIGTPISGRIHADLSDMVGMFVNTLPIRNYPKREKRLKDFLLEVKTKTLECYDNQMYQYEDLIKELDVVRDASHNLEKPAKLTT